MKTNKLLFSSILLAICFCANMSSAYSQWAKSIGGTKADYGQNITTDANGNVYIIGDFSGKADFDPGPDTYYLSSSCPCDESDPKKQDVFFAKYTKAGALIWARKIGGSGNEYGKAIGVDASGNVYITGSFELTADFDPSGNKFTLTSNGGLDVFLAKYNSNGYLIWANNIGSAYFDESNALSVSSTGSITIAGYFAGNVNFNPHGSTIFLDAGSSSDPFFAKYNTNGKLVWAKNIAGTGESAAESVFVDATGAIYITGNFYGTSDFDPGAGTFTLTGNDAKDPFYAKYNSTGNLVWATSISGAGDQTGQSIVADTLGNIYATGYFIGTVDFNPGENTHYLSSPGGTFNAYLLKLNNKGKFAWVKNIGSPQDDIGLSVAIDNKQNIYATGYFSGTVQFDAAATLTSTGSTDIYLAKYNTSGKLLFSKNFGGVTDDWASAVAADSKGFVYLTGYYTGTATFNFDGSTTTLTSVGNADVYFVKTKAVNTTLTPPVSRIVAPQVNSSFSVYPNPARNITAAQFTAKQQTTYQAILTDVQGRILIQQSVRALSGKNSFTVDLSKLSAGEYILILQNESERFSQKIIKQ